MYGLVVVGSIGAGLLTTWTIDVSTGKWIGYQILFGAGMGMGLQQSMIAVQVVLPIADVSIGTAIVIFAQMFGGSLFVGVAQNTFQNALVSGLATVPGVDPLVVLGAGATQITGLIKDPNLLQAVQVVYNNALTKTFMVALIMVCLSVLGAAGVEWKSVKGKKIEAAAA